MNHRVVLALSFGLLLAGCPSDPAPVDAGAVDARGSTDSPRVDAPRDAPPRLPDGLDDYQAAIATFVPHFCACVAPRTDPPITEAECVAQNQPDEPFEACTRVGFDAAPAAVNAFYQCLAASMTARDACYVSSDCSMAATDACNATATAANTACQAMITDEVGRAAVVAAETECIEETIIGTVSGDCLEPGAVSTGLGLAVFEGETTLGGNDTEPNPSCVPPASNGSADRAHRWRATDAGVYHIDLLGSEFDTVLYVRAGCEMMQLACNDDEEGGTPGLSGLLVTLAAGEEVVIIVDGFGQAQRGHYEVNIEYRGAADAGPGGADAGPAPVDAGPAPVDAGSDPDAGVDMDAGDPDAGGT